MTALNNALYVIDELTSSRRFATLERIPTQDEILDAIDTYLDLRQHATDGSISHLRTLRSLVERWSPSVDIPEDIQRTVRAFVEVGDELVPPAGWDAYDGYADTWEKKPLEPTK